MNFSMVHKIKNVHENSFKSTTSAFPHKNLQIITRCVTEKKGQDSRSQMCYISPICEEAANESTWIEMCTVQGWSPRRHHVCKLSKWIFQRFQFYRGSNFRFPTIFARALRQCMPVILWLRYYSNRKYRLELATHAQISTLNFENVLGQCHLTTILGRRCSSAATVNSYNRYAEITTARTFTEI